MKCPNCGVAGKNGATECAGCGVIFAKFKAQRERAVAELETGPAPEETNPLLDSSRWKVRLIAAAIVALWFVGFGLYYRRVVLAAAAAAARSRAR